MTFSGNLLYFPQFMTMYFADVGVWQFMMGHKWLLKKAATHWVDAPKTLYWAQRRRHQVRWNDINANSSGGVAWLWSGKGNR